MKEYKRFIFHWLDYVTFGLLMTFFKLFGTYCGYLKNSRGKFSSLKSDVFLLGGRNKIFCIALSLFGIYASAANILATVPEIYYYGTQYWLITLAIALMAITVATVYLPVFAALRINTSYEYLELRFGSVVRSMASILLVINEFLVLPIMLYAPALALSQSTGINVHLITVSACSLCVVYILLGGIDTMLHLYTWLNVIMFVVILIVFLVATTNANGFEQIFKTASDGGRLIFTNISTSPYERHSLWAVAIGGFFYWTSMHVANQSVVQRYMLLATLRQAQCSIAIFALGIIFFVSVCCYAGLLVFDYYKSCDPMSSGLLVSSEDQHFPLFIMQVIGHLNGVPGLFLASIFSAAMSSLSFVLNGTALYCIENVIKRLCGIQLSEEKSKYLIKLFVVCLGLSTVALAYAFEKLSGILSLLISISAISSSAIFGLFTLGMLMPWSNKNGALAGSMTAAFVSAWLTIVTQLGHATDGVAAASKLPISVSGCLENKTMQPAVSENEFSLQHLSFHWISPIGVVSSLAIGTIVSFFTGPTDLKTLDLKLISPVIYRFLPHECFS